MQSAYISSSTIERIGYNLGRLYVQFKSGGIYEYEGVPFAYFTSLKEVESAGKFLHRWIKGKFRYKRMEKDPFTPA